MNATLQALTRCSKFSPQSDTRVEGELSRVLEALREGQMVPSTRHLFSALSKENEAFSDVNEQQDAHDFLRTLFNCLDERVLVPFCMELETKIYCHECKQEHIKIEKALDLNVLTDCFNTLTLEDQLQSLSLEDEHGVKGFETSQNIDKYACEKCKQETGARLTRSIRSLPRHYLILHFNRFVRKKKGWQKDSTTLDLPLNLVIREGIQSEIVIKFELLSMVEHQGQSMDSGHYISIIRGDRIYGSDSSEEISTGHDWYWISDDQVKCIRQNEKSSVMKGRQPYLAFYARIGDQ